MTGRCSLMPGPVHAPDAGRQSRVGGRQPSRCAHRTRIPQERKQRMPVRSESTASGGSGATCSAPPTRRRRHRVAGGQRPRRPARRSPTCSSTTPTTARSRARSRRATPASRSTASEIRVLAERDPAALPWEELGAEVVIESTGPVHRPRERGQAPRGRRQEGRDLGTGHRPGRDRRARRQLRRGLRPGQHQIISNASCTTNCLAPIAKVLQDTRRDQARADDHDPRLHGRPAAAGHASPRPAPGPGGGDQPDPRLDRRRQGDRRGDPGAQRQAPRLRRPRARPDRQRRRPDHRGHPRDQRRGDQRGAEGRRREAR